jgi:hypothetical protein
MAFAASSIRVLFPGPFSLWLLRNRKIFGLGLIVAASGLAWQPSAKEFLTGYTLTRWPELYLPYWPFEPYFSVFIIGIGAWLTTRRS